MMQTIAINNFTIHFHSLPVIQEITEREIFELAQQGVLFAFTKSDINAYEKKLTNICIYNSTFHTERVAEITIKACRILDIDIDENHIFLAALLHDCGKICIPESILNSPKTFFPCDLERKIIQAHTIYAESILKELNLPKSIEKLTTKAATQHHERLDGSGYPYKITGEEIDLISQIIAVIDAYAALTENRTYRNAYTHQQAVEYLSQNIHQFHRPTVYALRTF